MVRKRHFEIVIAAAVALTLGCTSFAAPASAQSLSDRFKSLFGGSKSDDPPAAQDAPAAAAPGGGSSSDLSAAQVEDSCPQVSIRAGASTYSVAAPGKQAVGNDVRFQVTIAKTARDCRKTGADITARIGIQGRVIAGPAGAPASVEIPMRVAVVQGGVNEKVIATKAYRTTVQMTEDGSVPFTLVADDLVYPLPTVTTADSYIFYIGFDPQALAPEPKAKVAKKKK